MSQAQSLQSKLPGIVLGLAVVCIALAGVMIASFQQIKGLRAEVEQLHQELSGVKPWARELSALKEAVALAAPQVTQAVHTPAAAAPVKSAFESLAGLVRRYGPAEAQISLEVYSDFECSFCAGYHPVVKSIADSARGNVSVIFRHVPVHGEASRMEALAMECAGQQAGNTGAFQMADALFQNTAGSGRGLSKPLASVATDIGLDGVQFSRCLDSDYYMDKLKSDYEAARSLGISQTPTTVVKNTRTGNSTTLSGSVTPEQLLQAMSKVLN